jgi:hypothetical protein
MRFNGNEPRIMHFGKVKVGDRYSVSPMATLGPTVREFSNLERAKITREKESTRAERAESTNTRVRARQWCNTDGEVGNK